MMIMRGEWSKPLTKCRSRKSEAASPIGAAPNATLRWLDLAGLRRGLARLYFSEEHSRRGKIGKPDFGACRSDEADS